MNYLKRTLILFHDETKITIDYFTIITTAFLMMLSGILIDEHQYYLSLALLMVAVLPYIHELGHYFMAKKYGKEVSELNFLGSGAEAKVEGTLTHKETRDIALAGELLTGVVFVIAGLAVFMYGWINQSPYIYFAAVIPSIWIISWVWEGSDMLVAVKAHHFHNKQMMEAETHDEYKIGSE